MRVPDDVTLGWTDDNYGYIRQLPTAAEQRRSGGSGIYYHVSYWGFPHDYLWLCTTPPALIREEMTKAFDHGARRYWILNVGDLKPAEADIDYFLQLASNEPALAKVDQHTFLERWCAEQFPAAEACSDRGYSRPLLPAELRTQARVYGLQWIRRRHSPHQLQSACVGRSEPPARARMAGSEPRCAERRSSFARDFRDAYFELVGYPVDAAAAQNEKFLETDSSFLDSSQHHFDAMSQAGEHAQAAYDRIQSLTAVYNSLAGGKWDGMMSASPRDRQVFRMPRTATAADADQPLPDAWKAPDESASSSPSTAENRSRFIERDATVSINAAHFTRKYDGAEAHWRVLPDLGISGAAVVFGSPGLLANAQSVQPPAPAEAPWLEYSFTTQHHAAGTLTVVLLPTFPVDSQQRLRFGVSVDNRPSAMMDASGPGEWHETSAPVWAQNVLRNAALFTLPLGKLPAGAHIIRLIYQDPGVMFEHLVVTFPGAPPAYPVPPETVAP